MIITCPSCSTKFNLPEELYAPGRKSRCSQCRHVFSLPELKTQVVQEPVSSDETENTATDDVLNEETSAGYTSYDFDLPEMGEAKKEKGRKKKEQTGYSPAKKKNGKVERIILAVVILLLIAVVAGGSILLYATFSKDKDTVPTGNVNIPGVEDASGAEKSTVPNGVDLSGLYAETTNHFVVENDKIGRIYAIKGVVHNNSKTPKSLVMVEVVLYDQQNNKLLTQKAYCGTELTLFQLQILDKEGIISALTNQLEIITNNNGIRPGKTVPFLVVLTEPPADFNFSFEVSVVDAKEGTLEQQK